MFFSLSFLQPFWAFKFPARMLIGNFEIPHVFWSCCVIVQKWPSRVIITKPIAINFERVSLIRWRPTRLDCWWIGLGWQPTDWDCSWPCPSCQGTYQGRWRSSISCKWTHLKLKNQFQRGLSLRDNSFYCFTKLSSLGIFIRSWDQNHKINSFATLLITYWYWFFIFTQFSFGDKINSSLVWFLVDSIRYFPLFSLVVVITLVLLLRHFIAMRSISILQKMDCIWLNEQLMVFLMV